MLSEKESEGFCSYSICTLWRECGKMEKRYICQWEEKRNAMKTFREKYIQQIKILADQMRGEAMPPLTEELFALFETTGNRLEYENVYFRRRKFLAVFGMAVYVFKRPEDIEKLEEVIADILKEECWALPAHVNRRENACWRNTVDLFAAETAQALAGTVALVKEPEAALRETNPAAPGLSGKVCERVREDIERRVFLPYEAARQGWECSDHNWNAVCCGGVGSAAIYLLAGKEDARLEKMLKRICHSLTFYLDGFREDGACMEGIGYFTYGMTYFTGFGEQLLRYSKGNINLFDNGKVRKIAEFQQKVFFKSGQTVSFSDGDRQAKFRMGLTSFLAKQYDTVKLPNPEFACDFETDPCYRFMGLLQDYMWTEDCEKLCQTGLDASKEDNREFSRHDILPFAQWSICESKNGIGFAIKGGDNGEPHNHNDVGSFLYLVNDEQLLCDLGAGEYTGEYFGPGRYNILCNSSEGHNVPLLNGSGQKTGKQYGASCFEADGDGKTQIEFFKAYGENTAGHLMRETEFSLENGALIVTDCFGVPEEKVQERTEAVKPVSACFTENLVTQGKVGILENTITIHGKRACCRIQINSEFQNLRCIEKVHFNHEGKQEIVRLIRWDVMPETKSLTGEEGAVYHGVSKYIVWQQ